MKTYSNVKMVVDGKDTAELEIWREHNIFRIFEYGDNVFAGGYTNAIEYIEDWKQKKRELRDFLEATGHAVTFEQTIR